MRRLIAAAVMLAAGITPAVAHADDMEQLDYPEVGGEPKYEQETRIAAVYCPGLAS
jgi:hypothetical protein